MWIFSFYRLFIACAVAVLLFIFAGHHWWLALTGLVAVRAIFFGAEFLLNRFLVEQAFKAHSFTFKQQIGPYGIRLINKAETDYSLRKSLYEVFTANRKNLKKNVENLDVMEKLFSAGMRPDSETCHQHDLKLKYGTWRLESNK